MAKSKTTWSNATKNTSQWVKVGKSGSIWNNETMLPASWAYNAAGVTYNKVGYYYNYISMPPANQTNNKNSSTWSST